jgi:hypothetical protein
MTMAYYFAIFIASLALTWLFAKLAASGREKFMWGLLAFIAATFVICSAAGLWEAYGIHRP